MVSPDLLPSAGRALVVMFLMALVVAPSARGLPSNGSDSTKDSNRPSLELSFTNKLVKSEVGTKNQESRANDSVNGNSTVGSAARDKIPVTTGKPAVPQGPITKENSTLKTPPEGSLSTSPAPSPRTTPWLPYYFSSEAIERAAPPFPLDPGAIREGDAAPSRGRSGSPRLIDNFPPLQNQPGEEYLDAINRRTVVPPPPVVATTPTALTTAKSTIPGSSTTAKVDASQAKVGASGSVSALEFHSTTVDSEPDIGTAFSLSEDFTQGFLGFPVSETITDAEVGGKISVPTSAPHPEIPANSTSSAAATAAPGAPTPHPTENNFVETTLKPSSASPPTRGPTSTTPKPSRSSPAPESATKAANSTVGAKNSTGGAAVPVPDSPTTPPTTRPPATKRPNLRRRLPSFRATSPRPTIRRRLPAPLTTTETAFARPTTAAAAAAEQDMPIAVESAEDDAGSPPGTPFAPPIEPTTTRREYIMTVPPLLDFENVARDDAASDDEHVDASLEATHLTSANSGGGIIPEGATSAIIISAIIGGCAILFFAVLMVFCMWRQHVSRRPIYPPPESSNSSSTSSTAFHSKLG